jgi:signal transduction histidine kinase/CheY-like chemotaxis protein
MFSQVGSILAGGAKLRLPVLFALALAFSTLWLIFTFTLDVWATYERQQELTELAEQVDDQIYRKSEDISYQLLSSASLLSTREDFVLAMQNKNNYKLNNLIKSYYQTSSSHSLISRVELFDKSSSLIISFGANYQSEFSKTKLFQKSESKTGIYISETGDISLYAVVSIMSDTETLGYLQVSKPYTDLVNELASLNKVTLYLLANKELMQRSSAEKHQAVMGMQTDWQMFDSLVMCSLTQGNINLSELAPIVNKGTKNSSPNDMFLLDKQDIGENKVNIGLLPVYDAEGDNIGRILLIKNIDEAFSSYTTSLWVTSISFGIIISLIFISFWFFLGRIERNIASAEHEIIEAKEQAEKARDDAEQSKLQAEEANKIKSEFLAKMSHELRTPLNAIIGITEMMAEDAEEFGDNDYVEPLGRVLRSGKHLLALINDILDLSKIEAGKMELHPECFDLTMFIGDINRTCEPLALKNKNSLSITVEDCLDEMYADSTRLKQVILNLISNACKFTNEGEVSLIATATELNSQPAVKFEIKDTGIGMDSDQLSMLFQDFQQVDSSATRRYEGTGLGLSISQKLSNLMGGQVSVESKKGKGSRFTVIIPLNDSGTNHSLSMKSSDGVIKEDNQAQPADTNEKAAFSVLVVEDDDNMVQMLKHHFDKVNLKVEVAKDGNQALQKARANVPSLITLDINMPNLNGWDTLAAMKADEALKDIPIVVVTVQEEKKKGIELGASEYLTKPINKDDVSNIVNRFLGTTL